MNVQLFVRREEAGDYILQLNPEQQRAQRPPRARRESWDSGRICCLKLPCCLTMSTGVIAAIASIASFIYCFVTKNPVFPQMCTDNAMIAYPYVTCVGIGAAVISGCAMGCLDLCRHR